MKSRSPEARAGKGAEIRRYNRIDEPLAFVHVNLRDNRSASGPLGIEVRRKGRGYVIEVHGATPSPHDRLSERDGGPDQHLPQPDPRGSD